MPGIIFKQPNGLYCRFSTITDCPTHWNMNHAEALTVDALPGVRDFEEMKSLFVPNNMTLSEFEDICREIQDGIRDNS